MNIFSHLSSQGLKTKYNNDKFIYYRGDVGNSFYLINKGSVELSIFNLNGEKIILTELGQNDYFGQIEIFSHGIRPVNAMAHSGTELFCLSSEIIKNFIKSNSEHSLIIIENLCKMIDRGVEKIEDLVVLNAYQRVAKKLYELSVSEENMHLYISQKKISEFLGLSERTTNITLQRLKQEGLIILRRSRIEILNCEKLKLAYEADFSMTRRKNDSLSKKIYA
jgi:CRP/FNR family transcriptional regulator, cyclic AMP receptor protein